jgi:hypothetical protein
VQQLLAAARTPEGTGESRKATRPGMAERSNNHRSVLELSLRYGPLEARRTAFSVASAIFWRMRSEAQQPRT